MGRLAEKVPEPISKRVYERPEVFRVVAELTDQLLQSLAKDK